MPPTIAPSMNRLNMTFSFSRCHGVNGPFDAGTPPDLVAAGSELDDEGFAPLAPVFDLPKGVTGPTVQSRHPAHRVPPFPPAASVLAQSGQTSSSAS